MLLSRYLLSGLSTWVGLSELPGAAVHLLNTANDRFVIKSSNYSRVPTEPQQQHSQLRCCSALFL